VVSHEHDFGDDWKPAKMVMAGKKQVFLYVIPTRK
jgi:hypothetical protein